MIPRAAIDEWRRRAPWPTADQVEQDLVMARFVVEVASHPLLGEELVLRGGAALHELVAPEPLRATEHLAYARTSRTPIGPVLDALRGIADGAGLHVNTDVGARPRMRLRAPSTSGGDPMRFRIELDTYEVVPARPLRRVPYQVGSTWWAGHADVLTLQSEELAAVTLRTLLQRRKGRDLFDLWVALVVLGVDPTEIAACFDRYRPPGWTGAKVRRTLRDHLDDPRFGADLAPLVMRPPAGYEPNAAASLVADQLLDRI